MVELERIEPPLRSGQRRTKKTTVGIYEHTRNAVRDLAEDWSTSMTEVLRYLVDLARAGYVTVPARPVPVVVDYAVDDPPESIEAEAVKLIDAVILQHVTAQEARVMVTELIRLAGCEARASWVQGDGDDG